MSSAYSQANHVSDSREDSSEDTHSSRRTVSTQAPSNPNVLMNTEPLAAVPLATQGPRIRHTARKSVPIPRRVTEPQPQQPQRPILNWENGGPSAPIIGVPVGRYQQKVWEGQEPYVSERVRRLQDRSNEHALQLYTHHNMLDQLLSQMAVAHWVAPS
jgi:hypothetical protein